MGDRDDGKCEKLLMHRWWRGSRMGLHLGQLRLSRILCLFFTWSTKEWMEGLWTSLT